MVLEGHLLAKGEKYIIISLLEMTTITISRVPLHSLYGQRKTIFILRMVSESQILL